MKRLIPLGLGLLSAIIAHSMTVQAMTTENSDLLAKWQACQAERSPLIRLDCYDAILDKTTTTAPSQPMIQLSESAQLALQQEALRPTHTMDFIATQTDGDNPKIMITIPAIGAKPPRPILALSCIDNITRMQVIFPQSPMVSKEGRVRIIADKTEFNSIWFIRDQGHTLEASRGLPGIEEIKQILPAETLYFVSHNPKVNNIRFSISGLSNVIQPLRSACRW